MVVEALYLMVNRKKSGGTDIMAHRKQSGASTI
jgi:hypothetical protein